MTVPERESNITSLATEAGVLRTCLDANPNHPSASIYINNNLVTSVRIDQSNNNCTTCQVNTYQGLYENGPFNTYQYNVPNLSQSHKIVYYINETFIEDGESGELNLCFCCNECWLSYWACLDLESQFNSVMGKKLHEIDDVMSCNYCGNNF